MTPEQQIQNLDFQILDLIALRSTIAKELALNLKPSLEDRTYDLKLKLEKQKISESQLIKHGRTRKINTKFSRRLFRLLDHETTKIEQNIFGSELVLIKLEQKAAKIKSKSKKRSNSK